ncbi:MAG: zinc metallopeptidase [Atopobiaceae bacterium]|nr:zinc metallopeptidase [Atopobiaceae bacterium]
MPGLVLNGDVLYLIVVIASLVLGSFTQNRIKSEYSKWSGVPANVGETGAQVAERMLNSEGVYDVTIKPIKGRLTDNYDPRTNTLSLSQENLEGGSVASIAVACHEAGHALQNANGYALMRYRNLLAPIAGITSSTWMVAFIAGMMLNMIGLVQLAIVMFAATVVFHVITLPVEFDASARAMEYIETTGMDAVSVEGARSMLTAAAFTYVANALVSVLQLVYLFSSSKNRR